ncbi:eukaryotic translation initiation factor 4b [Anaeramoeba ignava]|uniref:Eukaryotic translation initiation factor 4b n=1 Tax=Anaeramoeba ignava TaxID=1746090 RepID=A0A9Q0LAJ9_ANAIG|nr:eukaryotic translation initiation factor 4b [Anaeramoeba ignava]
MKTKLKDLKPKDFEFPRSYEQKLFFFAEFETLEELKNLVEGNPKDIDESIENISPAEPKKEFQPRQDYNRRDRFSPKYSRNDRYLSKSDNFDKRSPKREFPKERPRLNLQERSKDTTQKGYRDPNIFGKAKPIDNKQKEKEIKKENKEKAKIRQLENQPKKQIPQNKFALLSDKIDK